MMVVVVVTTSVTLEEVLELELVAGAAVVVVVTDSVMVALAGMTMGRATGTAVALSPAATIATGKASTTTCAGVAFELF